MNLNDKINIKQDNAYFKISASEVLKSLLNEEEIKEESIIYENIHNIKYIKNINQRENDGGILFLVCFEIKNFSPTATFSSGHGLRRGVTHNLLNKIIEESGEETKEQLGLFPLTSQNMSKIEFTISSGLYGYIIFKYYPNHLKYNVVGNYISYNYVNANGYDDLVNALKGNHNTINNIEMGFRDNVDFRSKKFDKESIVRIMKKVPYKTIFLPNIYGEGRLCLGEGYKNRIRNLSQLPLEEHDIRVKSFFTENNFNSDLNTCFLDFFNHDKGYNSPNVYHLLLSHLLWFLIKHSNLDNLNFSTIANNKRFIAFKNQFKDDENLLDLCKKAVYSLDDRVRVKDLTSLVAILNVDIEKLSYFFNHYFEDIDESLI